MIVIRPLQPDDSFEDLTRLLHDAYRPLAERGMRYVASFQDVNTTRYRCEQGTCLVAVEGDRLVGTLTLNSVDNTTGCDWYEQPGVAACHQFAVHPDFQGSGVGRMLMDAIGDVAREQGISEIGVDTSEHATELIALYERNGFRHVGTADWPDTNYESVVMSRSLP